MGAIVQLENMNELQEWGERADSWMNLVTGLGVPGRDKAVHSFLGPVRQFSQVEVEDLYRGDAIAGRIVDTLPGDAVSNWFDLQVSALTTEEEELDAKEVNALSAGIQADFRRLKARVKTKQALRWDRLYGGAVLTMMIEDGREPEEPVDLENVRAVHALHPLHRHRVTQGPIETDPESRHFGLPGSYTLHPRVANDPTGFQVIHADRVLRFLSIDLPDDAKRRTMDRWGDSIFSRTHEALMDYQMAHRAAASLVHDFAQAVWGIPHLTEMLAAKREDLIQRRYAIQDFVRSTTNMVMIDNTLGETFERKTTPVGGLADLLDRTSFRLSAYTGMNMTKLFGMPPKGFAAEDKSGDDNWDDQVKTYQEEVVVPELEWLTRLLLAARKILPASWQLVPNPLEQPTEQEKANVKKTTAETDAIYLDREVLSPDEVADSRFTSEGFSTETTLDRENREEFSESEEEAAKAQGTPLEGAELGETEPTETVEAVKPGDLKPLMEILAKVGDGTIPPETAVQAISLAFPISEEQARAMVNPIEAGLVEKKAEAEANAAQMPPAMQANMGDPPDENKPNEGGEAAVETSPTEPPRPPQAKPEEEPPE